MFALICAWVNGWANTRDAGGLRRHRADYDVTAMSRMKNKPYPKHADACYNFNKNIRQSDFKNVNIISQNGSSYRPILSPCNAPLNETISKWIQKYLTHDDVIKWIHFPRYRPFVWGIHWSPVNSPHKGQCRRALIFSLICAWINDWANTRDTCGLRHHRAHYDVTAMSRVKNKSYSKHANAYYNLKQKHSPIRF